MKLKRCLTACMTAAFLTLGCGGGKGSPPGAGPAGPSATITPAQGGTITSADGRLTLVVPPNAVAKATVISVAPLAADKVAATAFPAGVAYQFSPDGLTFSTPARVRFHFTRAELASAVGSRPNPKGGPPGVAGKDFLVPVFPITQGSDGTLSPLANATLDTRGLADPGATDPLTVSADVGHFSSFWYWYGSIEIWLQPKAVPLVVGTTDIATASIWVGNFNRTYWAYVQNAAFSSPPALMAASHDLFPIWVPPYSGTRIGVDLTCTEYSASGPWYGAVDVWQPYGDVGILRSDGGVDGGDGDGGVSAADGGDGGTPVFDTSYWYGVRLWDWSTFGCNDRDGGDAGDAGDAGDVAIDGSGDDSGTGHPPNEDAAAAADAADAADGGGGPVIKSFVASFDQGCFCTHYTVTATDPTGGALSYSWSNTNPCGQFVGGNSNMATWTHPDSMTPGACPIEAIHPGTITVVVTGKGGSVRCSYAGGSGDGTIVQCVR
jgi:hypothetical protein